MEYIAPIIVAIGAIITGFFSYNQYTKNKQTDAKLEMWKKQEEDRGRRRSEDAGKIFGQLWEILHELNADRVYILQPHPLTSNTYISATMEVKRNGVASIKDSIRNMPLSDIAVLGRELSTREYFMYFNVETDVKDKRARALMSTNGCKSIIQRKLTDHHDKWIGNIIVGFTHHKTTDMINPVFARDILASAAENIQYILPEYNPIQI